MKHHIDMVVRGRVQHVGFRFYTQKAALEYGITGFVKNQPDGGVYIEAEGDPDSMHKFISWCHQGPGWARVDELLQNPAPLKNFTHFEIR